MRRLLKVTAAVLVVVIFFIFATLPARPVAVTWRGDPAIASRTVAGAYHVHSTRSDGAGDRTAIAGAASRAGLKFVIFTDHGDATRPPDAPAYVDGVLCIDAVEISTNQGHYVALDLPAAPYPLGGDAAAVVEDVARLGGFGFAAHPDSPRSELSWVQWTAPFDGLEWLNADTEWRDEGWTRLARVFAAYPFRPGPALASVLNRPAGTLARWDSLASTRRVVGIAGHDAHGGVRTPEEGGRASLLGFPSYESSFRSFSVRAILEQALSGAAAADARLLLGAIRDGRIFTAIDAVAAPAVLDFHAERGAERVLMGGMIPPGPARLVARAALPEGARIVLLHNRSEVTSIVSDELRHDLPAAEGAYRVEVRLRSGGDGRAPLVTSNPIYFLAPPAPMQPPPAPAVFAADAADHVQWHAEHDAVSRATMGVSGDETTLDFELKGGERVSQFGALVADLAPHEPFSVLRFTIGASKPMRVSVQLRYAESGGERWGTSVYVDGTGRQIEVPVARLLPADRQSGRSHDPARATSLLFVIDLTNARPGDAGTLRVSGLTFGR